MLFAYENLNNYQKIKTIIDGHPTNYVFTAKKINTDEIWYLALRRTEYAAQIDKAINAIFRKFIPSTPEAVLVKKGVDFYLASKEIPQTIAWINLNAEKANLCYFGGISVLSHFIGEADIHAGNLLVTQKNETYIAHKIDNAESLDSVALKNLKINHYDYDNKETAVNHAFNLETILENRWKYPLSIVNHSAYKKEQLDMIKQICETPFTEFEDIIQKNVIASPKEGNILFLKKMIKNVSTAFKKGELSENQKDKTLKLFHSELNNKTALNKIPEIDNILSLLKKRHDRYQEIYRQHARDYGLYLHGLC